MMKSDTLPCKSRSDVELKMEGAIAPSDDIFSSASLGDLHSNASLFIMVQILFGILNQKIRFAGCPGS